MSEIVRAEQDGAVMRLTINREERRNALNEEVCAALVAGVDRAEASADVRLVVITGAGERAFCAGGDLKPGADDAVHDRSRASEALRHLPVPPARSMRSADHRAG